MKTLTQALNDATLDRCGLTRDRVIKFCLDNQWYPIVDKKRITPDVMFDQMVREAAREAAKEAKLAQQQKTI